MGEDFSAFKALAGGVAALLIVTMVAPEVTGGQFDPLRLSKKKGRSVDPAPTTTTTTTTDGSLSGTTTTTTSTTTNSFYTEETMVPSNFDINTELLSATIPGSAAPDVVGAFRFICNAGQLRYDDPIVFPGQPGKSHLHQFYGNTTADAYSTYASLRGAGSSTCMSPLNRSAYWMPAMLNGRGSVVRPDFVAIYYKRRPITDPKCSLTSGDPQAEGNCVPLPNGLKFVFGYNMLDPAKTPTGSLYFNCQGTGAVPGTYPDLVTAAKNCPTGAQIGAVIKAPDCWDGKNLDSPDHRSHVAYGSYGSWGYYKCPTTHPYVIPAFTMGVWFTQASGETYSFVSDHMDTSPTHKRGDTFHADFFMAWDPAVHDLWEKNCLDKMLNCSAGVLGNGQQMKQSWPHTWTATPRLVDLPTT